MLYKCAKSYPEVYLAEWISKIFHTYPSVPKKPKKPVEPLLPKKEIVFEDKWAWTWTAIFFLAAIIITAIWSINGWSLFLFFAAGMGLLYRISETITATNIKYKKLLAEYKHQMELYKMALHFYDSDMIKYQSQMESYERECESFLDIHNRPPYYRKWFHDALPIHVDFQAINANENINTGIGEACFAKFLLDWNQSNQFFESIYTNSKIEESFGIGLHSPIVTYYPDIIVKTKSGFFIDVEIDEPYSAESCQPIHFMDGFKGKDDHRNELFIKSKWCVVRFAEEQVCRHPQSCIEFLVDLIKRIEDMNIPLVPEFEYHISKWTQEQASEWAKQDYRNSYLNIINGSV